MTLRAVGISASPSLTSRSRLLLTRALPHLESLGMQTSLIDLLDLSAEALLGRRTDPAAERAVADAVAADVLVLATPVYRATYSGQLKAFFDLLPRDGLLGHAVGLIATAGIKEHYLAIDQGLRPLVASLLGVTAARAVYVANNRSAGLANFPEEVDQQLAALAGELFSLAIGQNASVVPAVSAGSRS